MPSTIYLDCTHTYSSSLNTGIQRVVKNIVGNTQKISNNTCQIIPVVSISNKYYTFDNFAPTSQKKNHIKVFLKETYKKARTAASYILPKKLNNLIYHPNIANFLNKAADTILSSKQISKQLITQQPVSFNKKDILVLLDTTWMNTNYKQLAHLKKKKVKIVAVVYDMIPITHSQFCTLDLTLSLKHWYKNAFQYIDLYIAISKSVKEETYNYIKNNFDKNIPISKFDYFHLGANFDIKYCKNKVAESFKNNFNKENTYITVSTIEPRKNHSYILDVFDLLWEDNKDVKYIIIGRVGWDTAALIKRIKSHKHYNKKLLFLENVSDHELVYAYENSKAMIFASHIEGFGLPIVESLFYKLPVLASDIPIHREIGEEKVIYFGLSDPNSLLSIIQMQKIKKVEDFAWKNWYESTQELISKTRGIQ